MLDISNEIKEEEITVNVALRINDSFSISVPLSREENTKTYPVAVTTYNVMVQESDLFDFEYPETIKIETGAKNTLTIKVLPKSSSDDPLRPEDPTIPETGTLMIDYCNVYGVQMHYDVMTYYGNEIIKSEDIIGDTEIELEPGKYKVKARFTEEQQDFSLWSISRDGDSSNVKDSVFTITIDKGKTQLLGFYIKDNEIGTRNSQVVINALYGKELLGPNNAYGHDVSIDYTIKYATGLCLEKSGKTYEDINIALDYEFIPMKAEFNICAKDAISGKDVSNKYLIVPYSIYSNPDQLQGMTETKHINIYRGDIVEFKIEEELNENQSIFLCCEQFYMISSYSEDGKLKIAYDLPYTITCSIITTDEEGKKTSSFYCEYEGITFSEGDNTTITLKRNP